MKIPRFSRSPRSIAGRLTLRVSVAVLLIFIAVAAFIGALIWVLSMAVAMHSNQDAMNWSNERINRMLNTVEVGIANNVPEVEEFIDNPDKMYVITERILRLNPEMVGSAVAFKPDYYPQKGRQFAPYAYRVDSTTIKTKQLGTADYDYHHMEWYTMPSKLREGYWSEPYFDKGGGDRTMTTYSLPLFDRSGNMYAVLTADIALDWLSDMLQELDSLSRENSLLFDSENTFYSFVVSHTGSYIAHPDKKLIMKERIQDYFQQIFCQDGDSIVDKMISGKKGVEPFLDNGTLKFIYFAPIERTGWSMGIIIPWRDMISMSNWLGLTVLVVMGIGLLIILVICYFNIRKVTKPLSRFAHSADEIAKGNLGAGLPHITTKDEMRRLYDSFALMQTSLISQIEETKAVNEQKGRIESELMIARNIQMSMLPKTFPPFPDRNDIDIYGQLTPAKEVGGDLYDFFIRDEKLFFCIGDVSGKGVPASLLMAVTRSLFRSNSAHNSSPSYIVSQINDAIADTNDTLIFVTLFMGILDLPTGRLRYCNAGHCAPVLTGSDVVLLPITPNVPLGVVKKFRFGTQETIICPGTSIFLYTDGLTEAENSQKILFGEERMTAVCQDIYGDHLKETTPQQFVQNMTSAVHEFVGDAEQSDDLTMLVIRYTKQQEETTLQRTLTLPNDIESIPQLSEFIEAVCEEAGIDMSVTMSLNLAIEEAVVNVMSYAYPEGVKGDVNIEAIANSRRIKFIISDSGKPFDPTASQEVDTTLPAEERPIGGLGIHLVRQIMDSVNYEYADGHNILTLRKMLITEETE